VVDVEARDVRADAAAWPRGAGEDEARARSFPPLPPFRVRHFEIDAIAASLPSPDGPLELAAQRVSGSLRSQPLRRALRWAVRIEALVARGAGRERRVALAKARGRFGSAGLLVHSLKVEGDGISIAGIGYRRDDRLTHKVRADVDLDVLGVFGGDLARIGGRAELNGVLNGPLRDASFSARVRWLDAAVDGRPVGDAEGNVEGRREQLAISALRWHGFGTTVQGDGDLNLAGSLPFRVQVGEVQLDPQRVASVEGAICRFGNVLRTGTGSEGSGSTEDGDVGGCACPGIQTAAARAAQPERVTGIAANGKVGREPCSCACLLRIDGDFVLDGTLEPFAVGLEGEGKLITGSDTAGAGFTLRGRYAEHVSHLDVQLAQKELNTARVDLTLSGGSALSGELAVRLTDTGRAARLLGAEEMATLGGTLEARGELGGSLAHPELRATVSGRNVRLFGAVLDEVEGSASLAGRRLDVRTLRVASAGGEIEGRGTLALAITGRNDITLSARDVDGDLVVAVVGEVAGVHAPVGGGKVTAEVRVEGAWPRATLAGSAAVTGFRVWDEPFERADLSFEGELPRWSAAVSVLHRGEETLRADLSGTGASDIAASWSSAAWNLAKLRAASARGLRGRVAVEGRLQGRPPRLEGAMELRGTDVTWEKRALGAVSVTAEARGAEWSMHGRLLEDALRIQGRLDVRPEWPFDVEAAWSDAAVSPLLELDPNVHVSSTGSVRLHGRLQRLADASGEARVESFHLVEGSRRLDVAQPVVLRLAERQWSIESMTLEGKDARITVSGGGTLAGEVHLNISGDGPVSLAELVTNTIESSRGRFKISLDVDRSADGELALTGNGRLQDAAVDVGFSLVPNKVQGTFSVSGTEVSIQRLEGRAGGGTFSVGGSLDVRRGPDLTWQVNRVSTGFLEGAEDQVSGTGSVTGTWALPRVSGNVEVMRLLYDQRLALTDFMPWLKRALVPPRGRRAARPRLQLDIHLTAPGDIYIDNNVARLEMKADLQVGGDTRNLELSGAIEVLAGEVTVQRRKFDITSGTIEFRRELGLDPLLHFTAETEVSTRTETYTISAQVIGTGERPRILLTSDDPVLSQTDIVSLVSSGKTRSGTEGGGITTSDIVGVGAGLYKGQVEGTLGEFLPFDRIEIEPAFSSTTGAFEPRVAVGKDFTEDLSALVSTTIGAEVRRGVEMEYRFSPRFSVVGAWESETGTQAGAFGGRVKLAHPFRRLPRWSLLGGLWGGSGVEEK